MVDTGKIAGAISDLAEINHATRVSVFTLRSNGTIEAQHSTSAEEQRVTEKDSVFGIEQFLQARQKEGGARGQSTIVAVMQFNSATSIAVKDQGEIPDPSSTEIRPHLGFLADRRPGETFRDTCLRLWRGGMSITEIALEKGLSEHTISIALKGGETET